MVSPTGTSNEIDYYCQQAAVVLEPCFRDAILQRWFLIRHKMGYISITFSYQLSILLVKAFQ